jgi:hypothetical protein
MLLTSTAATALGAGKGVRPHSGPLAATRGPRAAACEVGVALPLIFEHGGKSPSQLSQSGDALIGPGAVVG